MAAQAQAIRLSEAAIFIEINATDGDAGIQIFLDGEYIGDVALKRRCLGQIADEPISRGDQTLVDLHFARVEQRAGDISDFGCGPVLDVTSGGSTQLSR